MLHNWYIASVLFSPFSDNCYLPNYFLQFEKDEKDLRKEISYTIRNIQGVRVGLFTPDMAFDIITKNQISNLESPAIKCVDMVSGELLTIIKDCAEAVCVCVCVSVFVCLCFSVCNNVYK